MREYSVPAVATRPASDNLADIPFRNAERAPGAVALCRATPRGWAPVTAAAFRDEVLALAKGLIAAGVGPGERVGLMSRTRYEWTLFDFALWAAGAVPVPVYETSSAEQLRWTLSDSGAACLVVETAEHERLAKDLLGELPALRKVWRIDAGAVGDLTAAGRDVPDERVAERRAALHAGSVATIIYTSGTTGRPKGCVLTHGNFYAECDAAIEVARPLLAAEDAATLIFLPLAHVFARMLQVSVLIAGCRVGHTPDTRDLTDDLASFQPTFLVGVPRVFQKVYNAAAAKAQASGRGRVFALAADAAIAYSQALDAGGPGLGLRLRHAAFDRLVYRKLRAALGGRCEHAISGGAPLGERLGHFFRGVGVPVLEGYGLTETTAAIALNGPDHARVGTVGRPLPGGTVRVAEDGEIQARGGFVFSGYWDGAKAAGGVAADGWFGTGDLGSLDEDGYLRITGRRKEIIVTAGGKNVAPAALEDRVAAHPLVAGCIVVGDQRPFIAALITIDREAFADWKRRHGKPEGADVAELARDGDLLAELGAAVDEANAAVSRAEAIRKFAVLDAEWTEQGGQITPSLKLKRDVVLREHAADVERLYGA